MQEAHYLRVLKIRILKHAVGANTSCCLVNGTPGSNANVEVFTIHLYLQYSHLQRCPSLRPAALLAQVILEFVAMHAW